VCETIPERQRPARPQGCRALRVGEVGRRPYRGGELFTFRGDDDVWVFVNNGLALDLGSLHVAVEGTIDFDAAADQLGRTVESNFRIETSIDSSSRWCWAERARRARDPKRRACCALAGAERSARGALMRERRCAAG
jgi:fibro-slime domain-containing protein